MIVVKKNKKTGAFIMKADDVFDDRRVLSDHPFVPSAYKYTRKASTEQRVENTFKDAEQ